MTLEDIRNKYGSEYVDAVHQLYLVQKYEIKKECEALNQPFDESRFKDAFFKTLTYEAVQKVVELIRKTETAE